LFPARSRPQDRNLNGKQNDAPQTLDHDKLKQEEMNQTLPASHHVAKIWVSVEFHDKYFHFLGEQAGAEKSLAEVLVGFPIVR
jgi:hypothetical protein